MAGETYYLTREVAERLRLSEITVRRLASEHKVGFLPSRRAGYRFTEDDIAALVEAMRARPEAS